MTVLAVTPVPVTLWPTARIPELTDETVMVVAEMPPVTTAALGTIEPVTNASMHRRVQFDENGRGRCLSGDARRRDSSPWAARSVGTLEGAVPLRGPNDPRPRDRTNARCRL
jgi:hypothetical protein